MDRTVILPGILYENADARPRHNAAVIIAAGVIESIVDASALSDTSGSEVVDARELTVLPGFVDMHLHVTTRGAGKLHEERSKSFDEYVSQGETNLANALSWGVTTVRDAGSDGAAVLALRDRRRDGTLVGPRVSACGAPITSPRGHLYWFGGEAAGTTAVEEQVARHAEQGFDHLKVMVSGGWATPGSDPRRVQFNNAELQALTAAARRMGLHTMGHSACTESVAQCLEAGIDTIEHCMFQAPDGSWEYPQAVASRIVDEKAWINPTPAWHYRTVTDPPADVSSAWIAELRATREARMDIYRRLLASGHEQWLVGTDTGGTNPRDYFPLVCQIMHEDIGLSTRQVLRAATSSAAQVLGLSAEIGQIRPGFRADLVALRADPTTDIRALWEVEWTAADGHLVAAPRDRVLDESTGGGPERLKV